MASERRAVRVRISGHVQGVYFRAWARGEAERLGLDGWVRNERDGSVTALISGPRSDVEAMIALLHRGPPEAVVSQVTAEEADAARCRRGLACGIDAASIALRAKQSFAPPSVLPDISPTGGEISRPLCWHSS